MSVLRRRAGTFQCNCHCVCELVEYKPSNHKFYPPCYLTHTSLNRIKPIINAVRVNISCIYDKKVYTIFRTSFSAYRGHTTPVLMFRGCEVAILNGNYPSLNCMPPDLLVCYQVWVEDTELNRIASERMRERQWSAE